ncbi:MAG: hypothetical protein UR60_C0013G0003 [Candidatus Moranbacteria bacterium GW2011_GWF2_34_56]|nr:MAG: hypothetical protein UR51_C0004G0022 [Candidatus Moranbacteria bacterium GW2011_GWF1_34_10]KKP64867.1 MAG: hypothetical protein UR60_C0013G0003 [Candidatus Moranbacteria bacterium GW2011_GWF2_34_56]
MLNYSFIITRKNTQIELFIAQNAGKTYVFSGDGRHERTPCRID